MRLFLMNTAIEARNHTFTSEVLYQLSYVGAAASIAVRTAGSPPAEARAAGCGFAAAPSAATPMTTAPPGATMTTWR